MSIIVAKHLRELLKANRTGETVIMEISERAVKLFKEKLDEISKFVATESMKGNYYKLSPIDIERGFQEWYKKKIGKISVTIS